MTTQDKSHCPSDTSGAEFPLHQIPLDSDPSPPTEEAEEFKEGGYGWVMVIAVGLILAHTFGINSMFGVFLAFYLKSDTYPGATPLQFAFVGGLSFAIAFLFAPIATASHRLFGPRVTVFFGAILVSGAYIAASFSREIWQLVLSQGVCFGAGMGSVSRRLRV
ncbi:putative mfs transporter protein [Eutypa lata UCREL1]|uniref:Putative mfs transporter protein n=1 Tax=Eutypa lata (strain UCR-EL1) TaxID=1287681 RepID=M7SYC4_EUTLA|nr:putative mfs transporter protein [Eutypa lata UCREL1]